MTNFVRVELENGSKASIPEAVATAADLKPLEDEKALDHRGRPRDVEFPEKAENADDQPATSGEKPGRAPSIFAADQNTNPGS